MMLRNGTAGAQRGALPGDSLVPPRYRNLRVWERSLELAQASYRLAACLRAPEGDAMATQIRKSAAAVAAHIAEGAEHERSEYRRHIAIALGMLAGLETYLDLCAHVALADAASLAPARHLSSGVRRMLRGLLRSLASPPGAARQHAPEIPAPREGVDVRGPPVINDRQRTH